MTRQAYATNHPPVGRNAPKPRTARLGGSGAGLWGPRKRTPGFGAQPRLMEARLGGSGAGLWSPRKRPPGGLARSPSDN